jgi:hypothetical protein
MSEQHWIEYETIRAKFWAVAQSEYGLDHDGVHEILGIKTLKEFGGTFEDAITALKQWEQGQLTSAMVAECKQLPEAPVVAFTDLISPNGFRWCVTVRAGLPPELARQAVVQTIDLMKMVEKGAQSSGWDAPGNNGRKAAVSPPSAPQATGTPPPASGGNGSTEARGTAPLNKITVDADGKVEFHVGRFRYPFKDARGPETVAGLFDPALGWTPGHFVPGAKYENEVNGLQVDWEKPGKYYDVVRVHR